MGNRIRTEELADDAEHDPFAREPGQRFHNAKKERFCELRATGKSIKHAAEESGYCDRQGRNLDKQEDIRSRIQELGEQSSQFVPISIGWVASKARQVVERAIEDGHGKVALEGLTFLRTMLKQDRELIGANTPLLPSPSAEPVPLQLPPNQFRNQLEKVLRTNTEEPIEVPAHAEEDDDDDD